MPRYGVLFFKRHPGRFDTGTHRQVVVTATTAGQASTKAKKEMRRLGYVVGDGKRSSVNWNAQSVIKMHDQEGGGEVRNRRNPDRIGTSYFVSRGAAERYYKEYGYNKDDVKRKLDDGEIHVGRPPLKPGDRLELTDGGKRYVVVTGNPKQVIKVRTPKGTFNAVAKRVNGKVKIFVTPDVARKINPSRHVLYEIYNSKTGDTFGRTFTTKKAATTFVKYLQAGTSLKLHWKVRVQK